MIKKMKIPFFLFWLVFAQVQTSAQSLPDSIRSFINSHLDSSYQASKVPGIFIGILNKGNRIFFERGYAHIEKKMRFDEHTIFEAGSITKTFTAYVLTAVLQEKGIEDTSRILSFLPDSVQKNKALENITFLQLLNHSAGFERIPTNMSKTDDPLAPYDHYGENDLYSYLTTVTPKPDGKSNYSNLGMGLAGVLAMRISKKSYAALLDDYIFIPFRIVSPKNSIVNSAKKSQGYFGEDTIAFWNMDILAPAGGIKCTPTEMLRYLEVMSQPQEGQMKKTIEKLLQPTLPINSRMKIARGWHIFEQKGKPVIYWHNGGTYGFSTFAAFCKETQQAIIVVVNKFSSNTVSDGLGMLIMNKLLP